MGFRFFRAFLPWLKHCNVPSDSSLLQTVLNKILLKNSWKTSQSFNLYVKNVPIAFEFPLKSLDHLFKWFWTILPITKICKNRRKDFFFIPSFTAFQFHLMLFHYYAGHVTIFLNVSSTCNKTKSEAQACIRNYLWKCLPKIREKISCIIKTKSFLFGWGGLKCDGREDFRRIQNFSMKI